MKNQWSYKVISVTEFLGIKPEKIEQELNKLGLQGWELTAAQQNGVTTLLYLKKQV